MNKSFLITRNFDITGYLIILDQSTANYVYVPVIYRLTKNQEIKIDNDRVYIGSGDTNTYLDHSQFNCSPQELYDKIERKHLPWYKRIFK